MKKIHSKCQNTDSFISDISSQMLLVRFSSQETVPLSYGTVSEKYLDYGKVVKIYILWKLGFFLTFTLTTLQYKLNENPVVLY